MSKNNTTKFDIYIEVYNTYKTLNAIKELIKDNVEIKDGKIEFKSVYNFTEDLLKLIKYSDTGFYNSLKQEMSSK